MTTKLPNSRKNSMRSPERKRVTRLQLRWFRPALHPLYLVTIILPSLLNSRGKRKRPVPAGPRSQNSRCRHFHRCRKATASRFLPHLPHHKGWLQASCNLHPKPKSAISPSFRLPDQANPPRLMRKIKKKTSGPSRSICPLLLWRRLC